MYTYLEVGITFTLPDDAFPSNSETTKGFQANMYVTGENLKNKVKIWSRGNHIY